MQEKIPKSPRTKEAFLSVRKTMKNRSGLGVPLRDVFFHNEGSDGVPYPMASLMNGAKGSGGGRGGKLRLSLYIYLLWVAAGKNHGSSRPASFWAELLGLDDPHDQGARRIRMAWKELERRNFVIIRPANKPGNNEEIIPLKEDGSGNLYTLPTGQNGDRYRRIPEIALRILFNDSESTGASIVIYLALRVLSLKAGRLDDLVLGKDYFSQETGMGDTTRKKGLEQLEYQGVISSHLEKMNAFGEKFTKDGSRRRVYSLEEEYFPVREGSHPMHLEEENTDLAEKKEALRKIME